MEVMNECPGGADGIDRAGVDPRRDFATMEFNPLVYATMNHHSSNGCCSLGRLKGKRT